MWWAVGNLGEASHTRIPRFVRPLSFPLVELKRQNVQKQISRGTLCQAFYWSVCVFIYVLSLSRRDLRQNINKAILLYLV